MNSYYPNKIFGRKEFIRIISLNKYSFGIIISKTSYFNFGGWKI